jgi:hypothetical protein
VTAVLHSQKSISHPDQKKTINKETSELNDSIDQRDLTDICRILLPTAAEYIFFSACYKNFSEIHHI